MANFSDKDESVISASSSADQEAIEIEATQINLDAADEALKQFAQRTFLLNNASQLVDKDGPRLTAGAILEHEEEVAKKRADIIEFANSHLEWMIHRDEWMQNREIKFMMMSARDASKLHEFVSKPEVKEKLREHLCKGGMTREIAEKAIKAFKEYADLKKEEQAGTLDSKERARMEELGESRLVKFAQKHAVRLAKKYGIDLDTPDTPDASAVTPANSPKSSFSMWLDQVKSVTNSTEEKQEAKKPDVHIEVRIISMHHEDEGLTQNFGHQARGDKAPQSDKDYAPQKRAEAAPALIPR